MPQERSLSKGRKNAEIRSQTINYTTTTNKCNIIPIICCDVTMTTTGMSLEMFAKMHIEMLLPSLTVYNAISKYMVMSVLGGKVQ